MSKSKNGTPLLKALFVEHRLPWRYIKFYKTTKNKLGFATVKKWNGLKISLRNSSDECVFSEVLGEIDAYNLKKEGVRLNKNDIVIDLGAHIGLFSLGIYDQVHKIYAFEPDPKNFDCLLWNIKKNKIKNISLINKAISNKIGKMNLLISDLTAARNSFYKNPFLNQNGKKCKSMEVACVTLKKLFKEKKINHCKLIKMDIEGAEYEVIFGLDHEILNKIDVFLIAYHENVIKNTKEDLIKFLSENNFEVRTGISRNFGGMIEGTIIAFRKNI